MKADDMRRDGIIVCDHCPHRTVAEKYVAPKVWQPQPTWSEEFRFVRNADLTNDTMELIPLLPPEVVGVIGIPISGMMPAAILSRMLCVPLYSLDHKEGVVSVGDGQRSRIDRKAIAGRESGLYVVVDDTVYSGGQMRRARQAMNQMGLRGIYAAVYTKDPKAVDVYSVHAPGSIILEWNVFNSGHMAGKSLFPELRGGVCCDFDGVICEEPPVNDARYPEEFQWWLANARPQYIPRKEPIPLIVSMRLEPWRAVTEAWMARWGVKTRKLVLHPAQTIRDRERDRDRVTVHKGRTFRDSQCSIMFESDPKQARAIADVSGKLVVVPTTGEVFKPDRMWRAVVTKKKYQPIEVHNLIYHVCPMERSNSWRKNLEQLMRRWGVFNGKKIIACADGPGIHPTSVVYDILPKDCKIVSIHNDIANREQATFPYLLDQIRNDSPNEATFYAHSKGIQTKANQVGSMQWRNAMYHYLLDDMEHVDECLQTHAAVGTTKITKKKREWIVPTGKTLPCQWIFAGTFFWFRHDVIFSYPQANIVYDDRYAVEAWLGTFLPVEEGVSLYQPWPDQVGFEPNAYDPRHYGKQFND
jgi:uncharacterized HAD superfamily protein/adenine/guanine phosphoribosyltransferase-like PRPP-binding protein